MSVGLNVEYTAHFVRSFMKHVGVSRDERVIFLILFFYILFKKR